MDLPAVLVRLLIGVLIYFIGEQVIKLVDNPKLSNILTIILIVAVVLYVVFGGTFPNY